MFEEKPVGRRDSLSSETTLSDSEEYLSVRDLLLEMGKVLLLAIAIIIPIRVFFFQPFFVQGASMEPSFEDGEYLVISEFGYKHTPIPLPARQVAIPAWKNLERQTPVVFRPPHKSEQYYIKRIIGLPGEALDVKNGQVKIYNTIHPDGFVLDEQAYLEPSVVTSDMPRLKLADNEYFVMGDNRPFSYDSRSFGPIKKEAIVGRVLLRAWPLPRFGVY